VPDQSDEPDARILDDAKYLEVLNARIDIFSIDGYGSLRDIGLLSLFIGLFCGIWLGFGPPHFFRDRPINAPNPNNGSSARQITPDFFLKADIAASSRYLPKRSTTSLSHDKTAHGHPAKSLSGARAGVVAAAAPPTRQMPEAGMARDAGLNARKEDRNPTSEGSLVQRADQLKKHSDYTGAFAEYRHALALNPQNEKALSGMGDLFRYSGFTDSAIRFYKASLAVNPRNPKVHDGLGTALYEESRRVLRPGFAKLRNIADPARYMEEQYDSAIAEYTRAITLDSGGVEALTNRGVLRDLNNDHDAAIEDYTLAIRLKPGNADAYGKRAETYQKLGRYADAVADYSAALKLDSTTYEFDPRLHFANVYFGRGSVFYKMGRLDDALADFDSTLALSPNHTLALISKGVALADKKRYDSAITEYSKAISLLTAGEYDGVKMLAFLQRGNSWKALERYDTAIADYRNAMESPNLAPKACWRIAEAECLKRDIPAALDWLKKAKSSGFADAKKWERDKELSLVWDTPDFKELTREHGP